MSKPWYADGLRFTCTQCGDCCRTHGDYAWVFLELGDITRLAKHLKLERREFLHRYTDSMDGVRVLKWPDDACTFLGKDGGCSVYDARPQQCRTWPFWPENLKRKTWETEIVPFCPGAGEGRLYQIGEIRKIAAGKRETGALPPGK